MEQPTTVVGAVTAVVDAYAALLHHYSAWKHERSRGNTYQRGSSQSGVTTAASTCSLSTSLRISGPMIKEAFDNGSSILGTEFSTGDVGTREKLVAQLQNLDERLDELRTANTAKSGPVDLAQLLQASESGRNFSLKALATQYQRLAVGRPIPKELPMPKPRSRQESLYQNEAGLADCGVGPFLDDDRMTTAMTISSGPLGFQSDPPSPPPTPKLVPDDSESIWVGSEVGGPAMLRPKNSVFSVFCPEAMTFQVNPTKRTPESKRCKCGYRWKLALPDKKDAILLKEGFRMTARFLAKSHCDKKAYGCVLCTSSGKTEKYESSEHLRVHINASHTKWQMLHDRDMT